MVGRGDGLLVAVVAASRLAQRAVLAVLFPPLHLRTYCDSTMTAATTATATATISIYHTDIRQNTIGNKGQRYVAMMRR